MIAKNAARFGLRFLVALCIVLFCNPQKAYASCRWVITPSDNANGLDNSLEGVSAISATDAWAAGEYYDYLNRRKVQTLIEHWDGSKWTLVPSANATRGSRPLDNYLFAVAAASASDVWAVGSFNTRTASEQALTEHWNGFTWAVVPNPKNSPSRLTGVVVISPSDAWAVGYSNLQTLTEHWNGNAWTVVQSPNVNSNGFFRGVTAVSASDVWAVGSYQDTAGKYQNLTEHWDGIRWTVVPSPSIYQSTLWGVSAGATSDVWAVGESWLSSTQLSRTVALHWNGARWTLVPGPNPSNDINMLVGVSGVSVGDVWAVGVQGPSGSQTLTEHWNGSQWSVVPSPNRLRGNTNELLGVAAVAQNDILTVGDFVNSGTHFQTLTLLFHC